MIRELIFDCCERISKELQSSFVKKTVDKGEAQNSSGDFVSPLDVVANDIFIDAARDSGIIRGIVSEELDDVLYFENDSRYLLSIDPLDGSSNLAINAPVATIFSVIEVPRGVTISQKEILEYASGPLMSGVCSYGFSTLLVLAENKEVSMFSYDCHEKQFRQIKKQIKIPSGLKCVALNYSYKSLYNSNLQQYIDYSFSGKREHTPNIRWFASSALELVRVLIEGGAYLYPGRIGNESGVLRKIYEAYPIAHICEAAGGGCFSDKGRMLDDKCAHLHEKTPIYFGDSEEMNLLFSFLNSSSVDDLEEQCSIYS